MTARPWLLYAYPWMPYPRRVIIYLREKGIPSSLVKVVPVTDPQLGDSAPPEFPPKPTGSLPILAIPPGGYRNNQSYTYIRQSNAIMSFLDELCEEGSHGFRLSKGSMRGTDPLSRARNMELLALADECTANWNPVRIFGTGAGTISIPAAAKEMIRWVHRPLAIIESWWKDRDFSSLHQGQGGHVTIAEVVLYQFLEFTKDCYGVDMSHGSGHTVKDVYGREVVERYTKIAEFYDAFKTRDSARRNAEAGEVPAEATLHKMHTWAEGSL
jgi:glutathione S-transferase